MFDMVKLAVKFDMMKHALKAATVDRKGVTALEYGVIAAAIIGVTIALFNGLGSTLVTKLTGIKTELGG